MVFGKVAILGPGLLGGSIALALHERGLAREFQLYGRRAESLAGAAAHGMEPFCSVSLEQVVTGAELIVLATPVGAMAQLLQAAMPYLAPGAVVTDVGSVKGQLVHDLTAICVQGGAGDGIHFVGSHPMAGSEQTGFQAARADLFVGAACFVTPTSDTPVELADRVQNFWEALGARVATATPEEHDPIVARISHVPHLAASLLVNLVGDQPNGAGEIALCGNGFRDSTRIASGSPEMWTEILLENSAAVVQALDALGSDLTAARELIASGDAAELQALLLRAKEARDRISASR